MMSMDGAILPINFYCRNARLCLKKAALSRKSQLYKDELQHLRAFETLVLSTIPGHSLYPERKEEKHILQLQLQLHEVRKRITEIESSRTTNRSSGNPINASIANGKCQNTTHIGCQNLSLESKKNGSAHSVVEGSKFKSREDNPGFRSQRTGESIIPGRSKHQRSNNGGVKRESNPCTRTRSADSTPLKKQRNRISSPRMACDFHASRASSQDKIQRQHRASAVGADPTSIKERQQDSKNNPKMQDTYAFASKPSPPRSKSTPILQRLRNVSECLGGESPLRTKDKSAAAKVASLSRENSPFRAKGHRELPRLKALGLMSSTARGKTSLKATIHLPKRFDNFLSSSGTQMHSEDEPELSNTLSNEGRLLSTDPVQMSGLGREDIKDIPKAASCPHRTSTGQNPSHASLAEKRDRKESAEPIFGLCDSHETFSAERKGREDEEVAENMRRDEAVWTTLRLQEQFGEALKELGSLQDRDGGAGAENCILHASSYQLHNGPPPEQQPGGHGGRGDKMHLLKLGAHVKGERLHEIEEEEAYFQQGGGAHTGSVDSDQSGRTSPIKNSRKKNVNSKQQNNNNSEESKVQYGENDDHLELLAATQSKDGSDNSGGYKDNLRGMKEDCQRFREHMKVLTETRIREIATPPRFQEQDSRYKKRRAREAKAGGLDFDDLTRGSEMEGEHAQRGSNWRNTQQRRDREERVVVIGGHSKNKNKAKSNNALSISPFSLSSTSSTSSSSLSSSLSSLPLSHYIQKLKHLAPECRLPLSPAQVVYPSHTNNTYAASKQQKPSSKFPHASPPASSKHHHHLEPESSKTLDSADSGGRSDDYNDEVTPPAILLPKSPPTSHASLSTRIQQRLGHLSKGKSGGSDQRLDAVLGGCALVQSHLQRSQDSSEGRVDSKERSNHYNGCGGHHHKGYLASRGNAGGHDLVSYVSHKRRKSTKQSAVFDRNMASIQRLVGELKGSVEGFKIRIEVESEGWRGRVEGLEKEIETLKDETDNEIMELKKIIRNEVKVRISELATDVERIRRDEKDQVESLVQERIESHLSGSNSTMGNLKQEIRSLWAEMENLTKGREEMQSHMRRLSQMSEESRDSTNKELRTLKREVQGADERNDWKKETEAEKTERAEARHALEKIKDEGLDMKMEVNGLKKAEKVVKSEMENIRKLVEKLQENTEATERERGTAQMEGVRERLLIIEKVESLSQLYLGGLEEVKTDVYSVKFSCRDRMDELESQWGELKRQRENGSEDGHTLNPQQWLLNEMELFRSEMGEIMETERGLLRETLEREHDCIRRQLMDMSNSNQNDLTCLMKIEVQKRVQAAKDKVISVADPMKNDMDRLRMDLEEAQQGAEAVAHALAMVEKERDLAAQAAADTTIAAEKAGEVLAEFLGPISQEMAVARRKSLALQDTISLDRDASTQALQEAKKLRLDFQELMEQEKIKLKTAMSLVHKERDSAATAASEASTSAVKAGEVFAEVFGSFSLEMAKARRKSYQLQEGLDQERENLERDREEVIQRSQESQEKFDEDLERAMTAWKRAMNQEVAKAKGITEGLEEDRRRVSMTVEQSNGHSMIGQAHFAKTQEVLAHLKTTVKQMQETEEINQDEKQRRRMLKQDTMRRKDLDQKMELSSLRQTIDDAISREESLREVVNESGKRIKKLEVLQMDLAQSFQDVKSATGDLEKTAAIWLPKYENAARIVNEISSKMESLEETCKGISADEGLMQQMVHVAESKVQSLKDKVAAGTELKDLFQKVENGDKAQREALSMLEVRMNQLETSVGPEDEGLSLKVDYMEKKTDKEGEISHHMIGLTQTVDNLERKLDLLTAQRQNDDEESNSDLTSKITGLESRIELVASATFTNLRLLDSKVEECTVNVHQALEGAATAENKCSALGTELVKVFRVLASSRQASPPVLPRTRSPPSCGRDHSPTKTNPVDQSPSPPPTRSPLNRRPQTHSPRSSAKRGLGPPKKRAGDFARSTMASEMRKVTPRSELEMQDEYVTADPSSPARESMKEPNAQALIVHQEESLDKGAPEFTSERTASMQEGEFKALDGLTISQDHQADENEKERANKCQRTNIRLEAGRIHVNDKDRHELGLIIARDSTCKSFPLSLRMHEIST